MKTKTEQIVENLTDKIREGALVPGKKVPSERELHEQLSVSRIIIRKAMSILEKRGIIIKKDRSGSYVTGQALEKIGYREEKKKTVKVGFVFHYRWARDSYFYAIIRELKTVLPDNVDLKIYFHSFLKKDVYLNEGVKILFIEHDYSDLEISKLDDSGIFSIVILRKSDTGNCLFFDNYDAGFKVGEMFKKLGHKTIAFINDYPRVGESELRMQGLSAAAKRFGLKLIPVNVSNYSRYGDFNDPRSAVEYLFSSHENFTAIIAPDDDRAYIIYDLLQNMNISMPEDISLVGFNNNFFSSMLSVPLTSACFPASNICVGMIKAINQFQESGNMQFQETIPASVIVRASCRSIN